MTPQTIFVLIMALSALNGMLHLTTQSGLIILLLVFAPVWWPEVFGFNVVVLAYACSLLIATATLLAGGVPAALYERIRGVRQPTAAAMWIWFLGCLAVAVFMLPTLAFRPPA